MYVCPRAFGQHPRDVLQALASQSPDARGTMRVVSRGSLDPSFGIAYSNRGNLHRAKGDLDQAFTDYDTAIQIDPKDGTANIQRGATNLMVGHDGAVTDAMTYLDNRGWHAEYSMYAALIGHFGLMRAGRVPEAGQILDEAAAKCDRSGWPYPVIRYLRREIGSDLFIGMSIDSRKMTEARTYIALDLSLSGRPHEAIEHLRWVIKNGRRDYLEYPLARSELKRLEGTHASDPEKLMIF